ncbi:GNAT family N-acetyltransferase [Sphaerotilus microaerophilus]|uniref:N-acetyltransferase domain-containing protein n=1 Tax=Sphaerotilus microaerophilus TaxID=2914710 RepID=A0ABM7YKS7_9BURK|nr:GNAT family N-acetyltransferase [Sphaerotilus sp. FB-5]BDI04921.1 hypothetical protein CATMQ487_18910 [Sphaerotilus sp. FB-5]
MVPMPEVSDTLPPAPGEPVRLRPARIRDWSRMLSLAQRHLPELDEATLGRWLRDERHSLVVAITSQGLVGLARLAVLPARQVSQLECLLVHDAARGQGVGTALLNYCDEVACACGAPRMEAHVPANDPVLRAFCAHHGFIEARRPAAAGGAVSVGHLGVSRRVPARLGPMWDLRRLHAPRVPPAALERAATRMLFDAWLGRSLRQRPDASPAAGQPWRLFSPVASGSAGA